MLASSPIVSEAESESESESESDAPELAPTVSSPQAGNSKHSGSAR